MRPTGRDHVELRLERYVESYDDVEDRILRADVSRLTTRLLATQLRKAGITL